MMKEKVLITGASGMLGGYLKEKFAAHEISTLGRSDTNDWIYDLSRQNPDFGDTEFDTVIHCAGTEDENGATLLNLDGTSRLLNALSSHPPLRFVYISSYQVYSPDAGENINEDENTWAHSEAGKSKARAEEVVRKWAGQHHVTLTVIRPARMFGNGVTGETLQLFNDALRGLYIHIRGNDARVSVVTALDVAKAIAKVYKEGGTFNAADGRNPRLIDMVEAMTANAGSRKRMNHLPASWAEWLWRLGRFIPFIDRNLNPKVAEKRMKTLTIDGSRLASAAGITYYDTLEVMALNHPDYPYTTGQETSKSAIREA